MSNETRSNIESIASSSSSTMMRRYLAQHMLKNDHWVSLAEHVPSVYGDFVFRAVEYAIDIQANEVEYTRAATSLIASGEMDNIFEQVESANSLAFVTVGSVHSLQRSGEELTIENLAPIMRMVASAIAKRVDMPFCSPEDKHVMHPLVVRGIVSNPELEAQLTALASSEVRDCYSAIKLLDLDVEPSLASGIL